MFITLEGGEGAGKSTQAALLADRLTAAGRVVLRTREPGGAPGAEVLRTLLLGGTIAWSTAAETHLHFAARAEHLARTILPALDAGEDVVCDRFADSTMAYQGYGLGADRALIAGLTRLLPIQPALTLLLRIQTATGTSRLAARPGGLDRYERLDAAFHARVAAGYDLLAAAEPARFIRIDGEGEVAEIAARIWSGRRAASVLIAPRENPHLFGHAAAEAGFAAARAAGRLHHAWLITGAEGIGKATLAYRLARTLLISAGDPNDPANPAFRRVAQATHADLLTVTREWDDKRKRQRSEIVIDGARDVSGFMRLTPAEGGWRVVIVDGAEHLNRNAANAILKVLEEPPARAIVLLTCAAPGRLLPTIRSRCRRLRLDPLGPDAMDQALALILPDHEPGLVALADGSPGRAALLADKGGVAIAALVDGVLQGGAASVVRAWDLADKLARSETGYSTFMDILRDRLGAAVRDAARGSQAGRAERFLARRPLGEWGEVWHALGRLQDDTERSNLDKRHAVVAGLELLNAP